MLCSGDIKERKIDYFGKGDSLEPACMYDYSTHMWGVLT